MRSGPEAEFAIDEPVHCDRIRIGQLLSNLLGNVVTHGAADKPVVVHAETRNDSFELWVGNAGEAIPATSMDKLFEPFFRGKARASKRGAGIGALHCLSDRKGPWGHFGRRVDACGDPFHLLDAFSQFGSRPDCCSSGMRLGGLILNRVAWCAGSLASFVSG